MTTTTPTPAPSATASSAGAAPGRTVAVITGAPEPHPTTWRTFVAMLAREFRVLSRNAPSTFIRSVVQPLLWVFVFTYVMPKIGAAGVFEAGAAGPPFPPSCCPA